MKGLAVSLLVIAFTATAFGQWTNCGTDVCTQSSTSSVGVGTSGPLAKLHVETDNNEAMRLVRSNTGWSYIATYRGATRQGVMGDLSSNGFGLWADGSTPLVFLTNSFVRMVIDSAGNVGVGTNTPGARVHINKSSTYTSEASAGMVITDTMPTYGIKLDVGVDNAANVAYLQTQIPTAYTKNLALQPNGGNVGVNKINPSIPFEVGGYLGSAVMPPNDTTPAVAGVRWSNRGAGGGAYNWLFAETSPDGAYGLSPNGLELYEYPNTGVPNCCIPRLVLRKAATAAPNNPAPLVIDGLGHVGIGGVWSPSPAYSLEVIGTVHATGDLVIDGNIAAKYQDVAEWVAASEAMSPGTVVVVDPDAVDGVRPSSSPYDTGVAGVVSAQPGITLGQAGQSKEKIATTGRVKVRVDATRGPIRAGDLLVTSDEAGVAMRSEPIDVGGAKIHRPGTLIGKALEPLRGGKGEILVLLSLQ